MVIEEVILLVFITLLRFASMPVKVVAQVIVIVQKDDISSDFWEFFWYTRYMEL